MHQLRASGELQVYNGTTWTNTAGDVTQHEIGESYGGGTIFYITPNGQHGLIAETQDQATSSDWYGAQNTISIAANHSIAGKNYCDWRFPTKNELNLLYNKKNIVGGFSNAGYWSSTEAYSNGACLQNFINGVQLDDVQFGYYCVRAVRSF